jgi:hypothetical protein
MTRETERIPPSNGQNVGVNYWLTTHYPHDRPGIPYFVFLPVMPESGAGPQIDDTVFFYERTGKFARHWCDRSSPHRNGRGAAGARQLLGRPTVRNPMRQPAGSAAHVLGELAG